jgi:hypothetical protein
MEQIRLPLGVESFAELRESGCYYIDKTGFRAVRIIMES